MVYRLGLTAHKTHTIIWIGLASIVVRVIKLWMRVGIRGKADSVDGYAVAMHNRMVMNKGWSMR